MSTLKVVSLQHPSSASVNAGTDSSGNFLMNSGYGSNVTAYGCRAWVNFNGTGTTSTNQTIRASGNVTSVFKNGTGDYTVNFTTAMPDTNYAVTTATGTTRSCTISTDFSIARTTSAVQINTYSSGSSAAIDQAWNQVAIFR